MDANSIWMMVVDDHVIAYAKHPLILVEKCNIFTHMSEYTVYDKACNLQVISGEMNKVILPGGVVIEGDYLEILPSIKCKRKKQSPFCTPIH